MADSTTLASNGVNAVGDNGGDQGKGLCWALHDFDAENEDELSFHAGEKIVITQRDELYGDGWYEVSRRPASHHPPKNNQAEI